MPITQRYRLLGALFGALLLIVGLLFFIRPAGQLRATMYVVTGALLVMGLVSLASAVLQARRADKPASEWGRALIDLGAAALLLIIGPRDVAELLPRLSAAWVLGSGAMKLVIATQSLRAGMRYWWITLCVGVLFLLLGALTLVNAVTRTLLVGIALGTMFTSAGAMMLLEFFQPGYEPRARPGSALVVARAFTPNATLRMIRKMMQGSRLNPDPLSQARCEVLVHLADSRPDILFGHVDIAVDEWVYSFGNYDSGSCKLFGCVSDGVLLVAPKRAYIDYALDVEGKLLIGYEVALDEAQMAALLGYLGTFVARAAQFVPAGLNEADTRDQASLVQRATGCKCYKPRGGGFATYFAIGTNCVRFVDEAIARTGRARHHVAGVLMPGDYLSMLERELKKPGGLVARRSVYGRKLPEAPGSGTEPGKSSSKVWHYSL